VIWNRSGRGPLFLHAASERRNKDMAKEIRKGDKAPDFTLPSDQGGEVRLRDLKGKKVVLYFYPKDNTSG